MADRRIYICGEPELRRRSRKVKEITDEIRELLDDMVTSMIHSNGVGLAGPQVGENIRVVVVAEFPEEDEEDDEDADDDEVGVIFHKLVNPRIVEKDGSVACNEGCLSLPTLYGTVMRPSRVVVEAFDENGEPVTVEGEGLTAQALCHEIDHLDGKLFIDRAEPESLAWMMPDSEVERGYRFQDTTVAEAEAAFLRMIERMRERDQETCE